VKQLKELFVLEGPTRPEEGDHRNADQQAVESERNARDVGMRKIENEPLIETMPLNRVWINPDD
jgi:hypothetical protein